MKELNELILPEALRYAEDHEWVRFEKATARIGISDFAQDQLGEIVYVELPAVGKQLAKGSEFGVIESVKAVSELYLPVGGKVTAVNTSLEEAPELVNSSPYDDGWLIDIELDDPQEENDLMTRDAYLEMLKG